MLAGTLRITGGCGTPSLSSPSDDLDHFHKCLARIARQLPPSERAGPLMEALASLDDAHDDAMADTDAAAEPSPAAQAPTHSSHGAAAVAH